MILANLNSLHFITSTPLPTTFSLNLVFNQIYNCLYFFSYFWAMFLRFHATSSIALHTTTLYTIVAMAVIRWRTMRQTNNKMMKPQFAWSRFLNFTARNKIRCSFQENICLCEFVGHNSLCAHFSGPRSDSSKKTTRQN